MIHQIVVHLNVDLLGFDATPEDVEAFCETYEMRVRDAFPAADIEVWANEYAEDKVRGDTEEEESEVWAALQDIWERTL